LEKREGSPDFWSGISLGIAIDNCQMMPTTRRKPIKDGERTANTRRNINGNRRTEEEHEKMTIKR